MNNHLLKLEPALVWKHFKVLCDTPRPSRHEAMIAAKIKAWAESEQLQVQQDEVGSLLIRKPASKGKENAPGVILQAHMDMVPQANASTRHNFLTDPIQTIIDGDQLRANGTTLGADNGLGLAMALAVLDSQDLVHPALEVLVTVEEETSLSGASQLRNDWLQGKCLINLDTENIDEVCVGCAGGEDVVIKQTLPLHAVPADYQVCKLNISGLLGGHSGVEIHLGRANANRLLVRMLRALQTKHDFHLLSLSGGTVRNALPREAWATLALPAAAYAELKRGLSDWQTLFYTEYKGVETADEIQVTLEEATATTGLNQADTATLIRVLHAAPHGMEQMSAEFPGVVETSNNLGLVHFNLDGTGDFSAWLLVRSLRYSAQMLLSDRIVALFELAGYSAEQHGGYVGWLPSASSPLLNTVQAVYQQVRGKAPHVVVVHAGLECGLIGAKYPGLDMLSMGPTITGAHSPDECADIPAVKECWKVLTATLAKLADN